MSKLSNKKPKIELKIIERRFLNKFKLKDYLLTEAILLAEKIK